MFRLVSVFVFVSTSAFAADPATWPQWRGPDRDGVVRNVAAWPNTLDSLVRTWRVDDLGPSYSGPIVSADRVYTTETVNKKTEVVTAYDRKTGKKVWATDWLGAMDVPFFAARNGSWIRSTPALDGDRLYVAGMRDVLVCLDAASGSIVWKLDFVAEYKTALPTFGFVCSPLVDADGVYVQAGASLVKVDKKTGRVLWRTLKDAGGMNDSAFSSPVLAVVAKKDQLVLQTRTKLAGVDCKSGAVLWEREIPSFRGMNILTPVPFGDAVFTSTYGGNSQLLRVKADGQRFVAEPGWSLKYEGHMTSPVVVNGHAYFLGRDQRLLCVNLETGKEAWRSEQRFGQYWSLVANGDKLLGLDQTGKLYLIKADPKEFDLIAERKVADAEAWAHLAVCGDEIIVRDLNGLTAYRWK